MYAASLAFITAIALAGVAAWFSITGLMAIFAALPFAIAIMAGVLEVAKLVTASVLYRNWKTLPLLLKSYLTSAVVILMFITSLGIFGYLSKAHIEQGAPVGNNFAKIERIDQRIAREQRSIDDAETVIDELDGVIATLIEYDKISGPQGARAVREGQAEERAALKEIIDGSQTAIDEFLDEKAELSSEIRAFETEIGPIKYIAALAYDDPDQHYEEAVRYIILLLIFVFDPLAVLLLIAANHIQMQRMPPKKEEEELPPLHVDESSIGEDHVVLGSMDEVNAMEEVFDTEDEYDTLTDAIDEQASPELQKLMASTPVLNLSNESAFDEAVDRFMQRDDEESLELFVDQTKPDEPPVEEVLEDELDMDDELRKRGYNSLAELSIEPDEILNEVVASLNTKERTQALTPTEAKYRNTCLNILHTRKNPFSDVKNNQT